MAGNHTGSSLSPMSYRPAWPLPFLKRALESAIFFPQVYLFHLVVCRVFYGCDRVYVYDGIINVQSIFSIYSVPFYKGHERLTEKMRHVSGNKTFNTRTFSLFYPFMSFLYQTVCDILLLYVCLSTGFFYALLNNCYFLFEFYEIL